MSAHGFTRGAPRRVTAVAAVLCAVFAAEAWAQDPPPPEPEDSAVLPELPPPLAISPGGALWRAFLLPGWGHLSIGSYSRGAFYFGAQASTLYTLFRARTRIGEAEDRVALRETLVREAALREGPLDPVEIQERVDSDAELGELNNLLDTRRDQQEDLVAMSLFLILISGVDAYVSAHLARFPDPIELETAPTLDGGVEVSLSIPLPGG